MGVSISEVIAVTKAWDALKQAVAVTEQHLEESPSLTLARRLGCLQSAQAALHEAMEVPDDG